MLFTTENRLCWHPQLKSRPMRQVTCKRASAASSQSSAKGVGDARQSKLHPLPSNTLIPVYSILDTRQVALPLVLRYTTEFLFSSPIPSSSWSRDVAATRHHVRRRPQAREGLQQRCWQVDSGGGEAWKGWKRQWLRSRGVNLDADHVCQTDAQGAIDKLLVLEKQARQVWHLLFFLPVEYMMIPSNLFRF